MAKVPEAFTVLESFDARIKIQKTQVCKTKATFLGTKLDEDG